MNVGRYLSTTPEALPPQVIDASLNKLSQGTPFPWTKVLPISVKCHFCARPFIVLTHFNTHRWREEVRSPKLLNSPISVKLGRLCLVRLSLQRKWIITQVIARGLKQLFRACRKGLIRFLFRRLRMVQCLQPSPGDIDHS